MTDDTNTEHQEDPSPTGSTTKLYIAVGVVCVVGTIMVVANGVQTGGALQGGSSSPVTAPPGIPLPNGWSSPSRIDQILNDGAKTTHVVSETAENFGGLVNGAIDWVDGYVPKESQDARSTNPPSP